MKAVPRVLVHLCLCVCLLLGSLPPLWSPGLQFPAMSNKLLVLMVPRRESGGFQATNTSSGFNISHCLELGKYSEVPLTPQGLITVEEVFFDVGSRRPPDFGRLSWPDSTPPPNSRLRPGQVLHGAVLCCLWLTNPCMAFPFCSQRTSHQHASPMQVHARRKLLF